LRIFRHNFGTNGGRKPVAIFGVSDTNEAT